MSVCSRRSIPWALLLTLAVVTAAPLAEAQQAPPALPTALLFDVADISEVDVLPLAALNPAELLKEDTQRRLDGAPYRFAISKDVYATPDATGNWEALPDGRMLWRMRVIADGATTINLGFGEFHLPEGALLWLYTPDAARRIRPFTSADNDAHGELWTPVLIGNEVVIELTVRPELVDELQLALTTIGHGYRGFGTKSVYEGYLSGSCNVDVVCPEGDDWELDVAASGAMQLNGSFLCSGSMVNDTASSLTPYWLTANHCGLSAGNAPSLVVYWNYQNSFCRVPGSAASGGPGNGTLTQFNSGSIWRAGYSPSDVTLAEFDDDPDPAWEVSFAGWDRSGVDATSAIAIHHPSVEEKRISFENDPTTTTTYLNNGIPGDGTHVRVEDWDVGTTEPGSSGSPLFDQNHRIIGQLHGGFASCSSQTSDWYGKFSVSFTGGGSPSSRLSDWLDPGNTGLQTVDTISLNTLCEDAGTVKFVASTYSCNGPANLEVVDCGLNTNDLVAETALINVSSPGEPSGESVLLTETGPATARFSGALVFGAGVGALTVSAGDIITATYVDADDGAGGTNLVLTANASIDCLAPALSNVAVSGVAAVTATVSFDANEPVKSTVFYGTSCGNLNQSVNDGVAASSLSLDLTGLDDDTTYFFAVEGTDEAGNVTVDNNGGSCYSFTTLPAPDYFTELFVSGNDLDNRTFEFTPSGTLDFYSLCGDSMTSLPTNPAGGTSITLTDDDTEFVGLTGGQRVFLYGQAYNGVWISSNGYVTLGQGDTDYDETLAEHFALPRVAPLYDDLNPTLGGDVSWRQLSDRFAVTWQGISEFSTTNSNTFQVELFFDGRVTMSYLGIDVDDCIAGLSAGNGLPVDFIPDNLSNAQGCGALCQLDLGFGGPGTGTLTMCGGDLSSGTTADVLLTGAPAGGTAFLILGLSNLPLPLKGGLLVPVPILSQQALTVNGAGEVLIANVPGGNGPVTVFAQYVYTDVAQTEGFGFSNALQIEFKP
ncbi:MAG: lysyl endopeptidase [Pseudohongiellaceae bacterium]|jgi:lysyl endopeptidase